MVGVLEQQIGLLRQILQLNIILVLVSFTYCIWPEKEKLTTENQI